MNCPLEIGGVGVDFNAIGEHFLGKRTDIVALVKNRLKGIVNFGEKVFGVVVRPQQF